MLEEPRLGSQIYTVDAHYVKADLAAIQLMVEKDEVAIIDTGTQYSLDHVRSGLEELGLGFANVSLIILTHVHLDHAGGASALMEQCPNAQLIVHPKGARHMADPSKLIAGSVAVYGEENFKNLFGEIKPIESARIIESSDEMTIDLAGRKLLFIDSPGHAYHHHAIIDEKTNAVFAGDALGVCYRVLRNKDEHGFIMPSTSPVQFDPDAMHATIDRIQAFQPDTAYLGHYSAVTPTTRMFAGLHEQIEDYVALTEAASDHGDEMTENLTKRLLEYAMRRCLNELPEIDPKIAKQWLSLDCELNAQGLSFWWQYRRNTSK